MAENNKSENRKFMSGEYEYPHLIKSLSLCSSAEKQAASGINYLKTRIQLIESAATEKASTASREDVVAVMDKLYAPENLLNQAFVDEIIAHETSNAYPQSALSFKRQAQACLSHDATNVINRIQCPVLIMTGKQDKYYTPLMAKDLSNYFRISKIAIISQAAHMIQLEQPNIFYEKINNFILLQNDFREA
jgi:pimeloyl-ACP methyl ester carboxylesterase